MDVPLGRQRESHPGFVMEDERYDCGQCIAATGLQCNFPPLDPANATAWELYQILAGQQRIGMDVIGLDMTAVPVVFDTYDIPHDDRPLLLEKLMLIDAATGRERDRRRERDKARETRGHKGSTTRLDV